MEAANLPTLLKFGNAKKIRTLVLFLQKILDGQETGGPGAEPDTDMLHKAHL